MTIKSNELLTAWLDTSQATHLWGVRDGDYRVDGFKVNSQYFLILQDDDGTFDVFTPLDNDQPVPQVLEQIEQYVEGVYDGAAVKTWLHQRIRHATQEPTLVEQYDPDAWDELRSATTAALDAYAASLKKKPGDEPGNKLGQIVKAIAEYQRGTGEDNDEPDGRTDDERALDQPTTEEKIRRSARVSGSCPDIGPEILAEHLMKREPQDALHEAMTALAASEETVTALRRELAALKERDDKPEDTVAALEARATYFTRAAKLAEPTPAQEMREDLDAKGVYDNDKPSDRDIDQKLRAAGHQAVREAMAPKRGGTP